MGSETISATGNEVCKLVLGFYPLPAFVCLNCVWENFGYHDGQLTTLLKKWYWGCNRSDFAKHFKSGKETLAKFLIHYRRAGGSFRGLATSNRRFHAFDSCPLAEHLPKNPAPRFTNICMSKAPGTFSTGGAWISKASKLAALISRFRSGPAELCD